MRRAPLLVALGLCNACGGAATAPKGGVPPSNDGPAREEQAPVQSQSPNDGAQPGYGQQPGQYGGGTTPQPATPAGPFAEEPPATLDEALSALDAAATELSAAGSDCERGCKALESMRRSSERICELNRPGDPGARCQKAKARVDSSREILERRCGSCQP